MCNQGCVRVKHHVLRSLRCVFGPQPSQCPEQQKAKAKVLKGLINRITPDNYAKLFNQVLAVGIEDAETQDVLLRKVRILLPNIMLIPQAK